MVVINFFFYKRETAYEMHISDWSSDVCSSDLCLCRHLHEHIQSNARDMARVQRVLERLLVDQAAARAIDDAHALLRLGEILAAQDIARAVGERRVERDEVGPGQKNVEREMLDDHFRSEERRVGTGCVSVCRSWG